MARKRISDMQAEWERLTVPLAPPLSEALELATEVHTEKTKIVRAALLMFIEGNAEDREQAMRRLARFEEKHGISTKRGAKAG